MSETLAFVPDIENNENLTVYHGELGIVVLPIHPLVPPDGGVNFTVIPNTETKPYFDQETPIRDTLKPFLLALATARAIIKEPGNEKASEYSQWVNVHAIPRFGGESHLQFEVIGKNARNPKAWAMPVKYPKQEGALSEEYPEYSRYGDMIPQDDGVNYASFPVVKEEIEQVIKQLENREAEIISSSKEITIFDGDIPENVVYNPQAIFKYKNFEINMPMKNPHVKEGGLHLWIHELTGKKAEGVQSDVKNGLEQFILASIVAKCIYQKLGRAIEIHFSGNWGLPTSLQQEEAVASGKDPEGQYIKENLSAHANLYAAPIGINRVELPERPIYRNPDTSEDEKDRVQQALNEGFEGYIKEFENRKVNEIINY